VPERIRRDFQETLRCRATGFNYAAALVGRRVLQAAVRERGGKGKDLKEEIESLTTLSAQLKAHAHEVRFTGNDAAHADEVSEDEVDDLLEFTEEVLRALYVLPSKLEAAQSRRKSKQTERK